MNTVLTERMIADAIVDEVCNCRTPGDTRRRRHARGFPECDTARRAATKLLRSFQTLHYNENRETA